MATPLTRRQMIARLALGAGSGAIVPPIFAQTDSPSASAIPGAAAQPQGPAPAPAAQPSAEAPFRYCLNSATIRGQNALPIERQIEIAAQAGYDGIEPWTRDLAQYRDKGGSLAELKARLEDAGLAVEGAIGFPRWAAGDEKIRAEALEQFKKEAAVVAAIGGTRIAAPPAGLNKASSATLDELAERYRVLLEIGEGLGVAPMLELWGASPALSRLGEAAYVAVEAGHPAARLLLDVYHIYKGGSDFAGLAALNGAAMDVFHINDYPPDPPRQTISDSDRVFPGDGVAPLGRILRTLRDSGFRGALSLELFSRRYAEDDPMAAAREGLEKMRAAVAFALSPEAAALTAAEEKRYADPARFEAAIAAFEEDDKTTRPAEGAVLILGSSTIKRWPQTIHADLEPLSLLVRGFGGSTMNDALHFAERIAIRHKPRAVVVYEGDNDIAQGLRAETVLRSFLALAERIHRALPDTRIYAISIKPSLKRWALWPEIRRANALIAHACAQDERMEYLDMVPPMLDAAGRPRPELFVQDGLHLSVEGYALWAQLLRGTLVESERPYENAAGAGLARR